MPQQRSQHARAGMLRDALKTEGLESKSSKAEPGVLTMSAPARLTGRGDVCSSREDTEIPWEELPSADAYCCLPSSGRQAPSAK